MHAFSRIYDRLQRRKLRLRVGFPANDRESAPGWALSLPHTKLLSALFKFLHRRDWATDTTQPDNKRVALQIPLNHLERTFKVVVTENATCFSIISI
jgi:hypothetical protein